MARTLAAQGSGTHVQSWERLLPTQPHCKTMKPTFSQRPGLKELRQKMIEQDTPCLPLASVATRSWTYIYPPIHIREKVRKSLCK